MTIRAPTTWLHSIIQCLYPLGPKAPVVTEYTTFKNWLHRHRKTLQKTKGKRTVKLLLGAKALVYAIYSLQEVVLVPLRA